VFLSEFGFQNKEFLLTLLSQTKRKLGIVFYESRCTHHSIV